MLATESFFKADEVRKIFSRKERKELKGGNGVRAANVVTLYLKGEIPYCEEDNVPWM